MKAKKWKDIVRLSRVKLEEKQEVKQETKKEKTEQSFDIHKELGDLWIENAHCLQYITRLQKKVKEEGDFTLRELLRLWDLVAEVHRKLEAKIIFTQALAEICLGVFFLFLAWLFCGWLGIVSSALAGLFGGFAVADLLASWKMSRLKKEEKEE